MNDCRRIVLTFSQHYSRLGVQNVSRQQIFKTENQKAVSVDIRLVIESQTKII